MFRTLLVVALVALTGTAQDKKDPPKKKERIAVAEPKDAAKDPDFAIQGEYEGQINGRVRRAVQVVAKGVGEFDVKMYDGGLPGAGWDGKSMLKATAKRTAPDGGAALGGGALDGTIAGGKFEVKDGEKVMFTLNRVERTSPTIGAKPPEGAVVLYGTEGDETKWNGGRLMTLSDGKFLTPANIDGKRGDIKTKEKFGAFKVPVVLPLPWITPYVFSVNVPQAFKMHVEFRLPWMPNSTGQARGNSGVYLQDRYECQVLDSFGLNGENNECGGIYTQHKPSVNMCLPPLVWQTYDIEFAPAVFDADGKKTKNGRATILHNGVKIHDNIEFPKDCPGGQPEKADPGPFRLQDHGDPVIYRNVWVLPVK